MEFVSPWSSGGRVSSRSASSLSKPSYFPDSDNTSYLIFSSSSLHSSSYSLIYISDSFLFFSGSNLPGTFSWSGRISSISPEMISFHELRKSNSMSLISGALFGSSLVYSLYVPRCLCLFQMNDMVRYFGFFSSVITQQNISSLMEWKNHTHISGCQGFLEPYTS